MVDKRALHLSLSINFMSSEYSLIFDNCHQLHLSHVSATDTNSPIAKDNNISSSIKNVDCDVLMGLQINADFAEFAFCSPAKIK